MYTIRPDRPLNPATRRILETLRSIAGAHQASYFVIGATARDLLMTHVFGIDSGRETRDVDFAIALADWSQFERIKHDFVQTGDFVTAAAEAHRLYYAQDQHQFAYPIDLIPFGKIESEGNRIAWPPDMNIVMNVAGYGEALASAIPIDLGEGLTIPVVSIAALAALKLLAWDERGLEDNKDALDLMFLLKNFHHAGNIDRLYGDAFSLVQSNDFKIDLAGAALLGHDIKRILRPSTKQALLNVLASPAKRDRLTIHMRPSNVEEGAPEMAQFLDQFERGLRLDSL